MNYSKQRIISPLKAFGGKSYLAKKIISHMENRSIFVEGFCYTSIVSLSLDETFKRHICIDKNPHVVNFWRTLQNQPERLHKFLLNTEYSEENFNRAKQHIRLHEDCEGDEFFNAAMFFYLNRSSRSADMKTFGWSDRLRRGMPEYISAYKSAVDNLLFIADRVKNIEFYCGDYSTLMVELGLCKNIKVVVYNDPPYLHETRVSTKAYGKYEMTKEEHIDLLNFIKSSNVLTYLSGYDSSLYNSMLPGCKQYRWDLTNSSSQKQNKPIMTEVLWEINYVI